MINHPNNLLRHLFIAQIAESTSDDRVGLQPPDEDWRGHVTNMKHNVLDIYLPDLRENRKLCSKTGCALSRTVLSMKKLVPADYQFRDSNQ